MRHAVLGLLLLLAIPTVRGGASPVAETVVDHDRDSSASWKVGVLAAADARGGLRACNCPGEPAGGLSLRAGSMTRAAALGYPMVMVDGGNFVPPPEDTLREAKSALVLDAMSLMPFDAVGLGDLELELGLAFLRKAARRLPLVAANVQLPPDLAALIPPVRWLERDGLRIAVTGYVDPMRYYTWPVALERSPDSLLVLDPGETLGPLLASIRDEADLVVVLAHAGAQDIHAQWGTTSPVDLFVQGAELDAAEHVGLGTSQLVAPGKDGKQLVMINLLGTPGSGVAVEEFRIWDLKRGGRTDTRVEALIDAFEATWISAPR